MLNTVNLNELTAESIQQMMNDLTLDNYTLTVINVYFFDPQVTLLLTYNGQISSSSKLKRFIKQKCRKKVPEFQELYF